MENSSELLKFPQPDHVHTKLYTEKASTPHPDLINNKPLETGLNTKKLFRWIPNKIRRFFVKESPYKEPIDLTSPKVIGKYFTSRAEVEDVLDIIKQVKNPTLIQIVGSRTKLNHPPLFENAESFNSYHNKKAKGDLTDYLAGEGLSIKDYQLAEKYLKEGFNEGYMRGNKYPEPIVRLLVKDIDLNIKSGDKNFHGGPRIGKRTNVILDVDARSTFPDAIPLKY